MATTRGSNMTYELQFPTLMQPTTVLCALQPSRAPVADWACTQCGRSDCLEDTCEECEQVICSGSAHYEDVTGYDTPWEIRDTKTWCLSCWAAHTGQVNGNA
jgi:hypothetical protein